VKTSVEYPALPSTNSAEDGNNNNNNSNDDEKRITAFRENMQFTLWEIRLVTCHCSVITPVLFAVPLHLS
jgi:hypothetical protein